MDEMRHWNPLFFKLGMYKRLTWEEAVKNDLKEWNVSQELALDRSAWKLAIYVPEP